MQGANKGIGKLPKKLKLAADEATLESTNESTTEPTAEPTTLESISQSTTERTAEPTTLESINQSTTDEPTTERTAEPTTLESINESTTDEPSTEPATLESNESVIVKLNPIEPLETSGDIHRQGTDEVMTRPVVVSAIEGDEQLLVKRRKAIFL
jgi:hypothetical protein